MNDIVSREIYIFLKFLFLLFLGRFSPWESFFYRKRTKMLKKCPAKKMKTVNFIVGKFEEK